MDVRQSLGTGLVVTAVSVLIWFLAARETRTQVEVFGTAEFQVDGERWIVDPSHRGITVRVDGSSLATQNASDVFRSGPMIMKVPAEVTRRRTVDLLERLQNDERVQGTGARIVSVEPASLDVAVDELVPLRATIQHDLPDTVRIESVTFAPSEVTVWVPSRARDQLPQELVVSAVIDPSRVQTLEPGLHHTLEARLRKPASWPASPNITIEPQLVQVSFTVRSLIEQITLETVRVHVAGPHEDFSEYDIELEPTVLRNVTVAVDDRLKALIESGEATVVAIVHLSYRDKELPIKSKPVAYYQALLEGWTRAEPVRAVGEMPVIGLAIRRRGEPPATPPQ